MISYDPFYLWIQVGTKVSAVSRKTNTTTHEILGVLTKGNTQIVCHIIKFIYSCAGSLVCHFIKFIY